MTSPRSRRRWAPAVAVLVLVASGAVIGCTSGAPPASVGSPATTAPAIPSSSSAPSRVPGLTAPPPSAAAPTPSAIGDAPPAATLVAEGGDPVDGQLGTYTWAGNGSDSPWLHGTPLAVGRGEPLTMEFRPPIDIATWHARYVPVIADDPTGATELGEGVGGPKFAAPGVGHWTVEVAVTFADDAGSARYFWALDVTG